jgi:uncharacterized C2H2 Zn-finger protein
MSGPMNQRCRRCGRPFKLAGSLAKHLNDHRESDEMLVKMRLKAAR